MAISGAGGFQGALGGGISGAEVGGPIGGAVGGLLGGVAGLFGGSGRPKYDPASEQLTAQSYDLFQQAQGLLYPAESQMVRFATDVNAPGQAAQKAIGDVQSQYATQGSARDRLYKLLGYTPTAQQAQAVERQTELGQATSEAEAANAARRGTIGLQQSVLGG